MGTEKERLRRWREKNRAKGKKSYTIMLSREAQYILKREKERSETTYSSIIERALLRLKSTSVTAVKIGEIGVTSNEIGVTRNVTSNDEVGSARLLIDDEMAMKGFGSTTEYGIGKIEENREELRNGLIPRLLKMSKRRKFRLKK
ncbi:MAG: hypothetical protein JRC86_06855 [Deltaproteobacteria bacterium]|nr:hypothetical protein [Deltaproteobacteria bacterium]